MSVWCLSICLWVTEMAKPISKNVIFWSRWRVIMTTLSAPSHHIISIDLKCEWKPHLCVVMVGDLLSCAFSITEGRGKKDGKCVWPTISIFLGTSRLISLPGVEGLTWTLDSFPLSNRPRLILSLSLSLSFSTILYPSVLSESASICLFPHLCIFTVSAAKLPSVNREPVCVCVRVFLCVWHASYWTPTINLWPPRSPWVKRSDIK